MAMASLVLPVPVAMASSIARRPVASSVFDGFDRPLLIRP